MLHSRTTPLLAVVFALSAIHTAASQCPQPDGLGNGPCCTAVQPKLPPQATFTQGALGICWRDCDVDQFDAYTAHWGIPPFLPFVVIGGASQCGDWLATLELRDAMSALQWTGLLRMQYSRTWLETDTMGRNLQVWRFLVNGDLSPVGNQLAPCPVPSCAAAHGNRVRFTGYVDYARYCGGNTFEFAWMLNHGCDVIDHAPNFPRAGFFHFNRAFTFVGPSASFAIGPLQATASGGTSLEAVRRRRVPAGVGPILCEYEEQIDCGLEMQQELCICGFPTAPSQYLIGDLGLASACGTSITTPGGPYLPGYLSMGIGAWTNPSRYPGIEALRWNCGGYDYFDPCTSNTRSEVFFGVTTLGGYHASRVLSAGSGLPLPLTFVDQANSLHNGATTMNVPFVADHILNLNFK